MKKELKEQLLEFVNQYPNDTDLGKAFRELTNRYNQGGSKLIRNATELEKLFIELECIKVRHEIIYSLLNVISEEGNSVFDVEYLKTKFLTV